MLLIREPSTHVNHAVSIDFIRLLKVPIHIAYCYEEIRV